VASSWEVDRAGESTGQVRRQKRESESGLEPEPTIKRRLQNACDKAAAGQPTVRQYRQRLKDEGIETQLKQTRTGKIQGISYKLEDVAFPGHKLGKDYSWQGLERLGILEQENNLRRARKQKRELEL